MDLFKFLDSTYPLDFDEISHASLSGCKKAPQKNVAMMVGLLGIEIIVEKCDGEMSIFELFKNYLHHVSQNS